jgi:hypothetical protein
MALSLLTLSIEMFMPVRPDANSRTVHSRVRRQPEYVVSTFSRTVSSPRTPSGGTDAAG